MSDIGFATVAIVPSARGFGSALNSQIGGQVSSVGRTSGLNIGKALVAGIGAVGIGAGVAAAVSGSMNLVKRAIDVASDFQNVQIGLTTLLGSAKKATVLMGQVKQFAASTPFSFQDAAAGAQRLAGIGVASDKIIPILKTLGDTTAATGGTQEQFNSILLAYSQSASNGVVNMQDLNQMVQAGVPIYAEAAKAYGVSTGKIREMVASGKVDSTQFWSKTNQQLQKDYGGSMAKMAGTLTGLFSNFHDTIDQTLAQGIKPFVPYLQKIIPQAATLAGGAIKLGFGAALSITKALIPLVKGAADGFKQFMAGFNATDPSTMQSLATSGNAFANAGLAIRTKWENLKAVVGPPLDALKDFVANVTPSQIQTLAIGVGALAAGFAAFKAGSAAVGAFGAVEGLVAAVAAAPEITVPLLAIAAAVAIIAGAFGLAYKNSAAFRDLVGKAFTAIGAAIDTLSATYGPVIADIAKKFKPIADAIGTIATVITNFLASAAMAFLTAAFQNLVDVVKAIAPYIQDFYDAIATQLKPAIDDFVKNDLPPLKKGFDQIVAAIGPIVRDLGGKFVDFINTVGPIAGPLGTILGTVLAVGFTLLGKALRVVIDIITGNWSDAWKTLTKPVSDALGKAGKAVSKGISDVKGFIGKGLSDAKGTWDRAWSAISGTIGKIWAGLVKGVQTGIGNVTKVVGGLKSKVTGAIGNAAGWLVQAGKDILAGLVQGINDAIGTVKTALGKVTSMIPSWKGPPSTDKKLLTPAGQMIMAGLVGGINDGSPAVKNTLTALTSDMIETTKSALGIHSPSTVFASIGTDLSRGFLLGLTKSQDPILANVADLATKVKDAFANAASEVKTATAKITTDNKSLAVALARRADFTKKTSKATRLANANTIASLKKDIASQKALIAADQKVDSSKNKSTVLALITKANAALAVQIQKRDDLAPLLDAANTDLTNKINERSSFIDGVVSAVQNLGNVSSIYSTVTDALNTATNNLASAQTDLATVNKSIADDNATRASLIQQIADATVTSTTSTSKMARDAALTSISDLTSQLNDLDTELSGYADQRNTLLGNISDYTAQSNKSVSQSIIESLQTSIAQTNSFTAALATLRSQGLDDATYQQIISAGVSGGGLATAQGLLSGGPDAVKQIAALQAQLTAAGTSLGTSTGNSLYNAGIDAAQGLVDGLNAQSDAITAAMDKIADSLVTSIKKKLDINSPSKVLHQIGVYTGQGMANGLTATGNLIKKASEVLTPTVGWANPSTPTVASALTSAGDTHVDYNYTQVGGQGLTAEQELARSARVLRQKMRGR